MTPSAATPVIAYCRVSTDEQGDTGASLDAQAHELTAYAEARGWPITVVREVASGKSLRRRPVMAAALAALRDGKASGIMATTIDRLSRNVGDGSAILSRSEREGWNLVLLSMGGETLDTTTAMGRAFFNVAMTFAQLHRDTISDSTKRGLAQRKREGVTLGRPKSTDARARELRPEEGARLDAALPIIRAERLRTPPTSYRKIAALLNDRGLASPQGGRWHDPTVLHAVRRYGLTDSPSGGNEDARDKGTLHDGDGGDSPQHGRGERGTGRGTGPGDAQGDVAGVRDGMGQRAMAHAVAVVERLDAEADDLEADHEALLIEASRFLRDSWNPDGKNYGSMDLKGHGRRDQNVNPYAFNGGNGNSWHYVDGKRRTLTQYREVYISWARGDEDAPAFPQGTPSPPDSFIADLDRASELRLAAGAHRRHVHVLQSSPDDWAYDDADRALAQREVDALLQETVK